MKGTQITMLLPIQFGFSHKNHVFCGFYGFYTNEAFKNIYGFNFYRFLYGTHENLDVSFPAYLLAERDT